MAYGNGRMANTTTRTKSSTSTVSANIAATASGETKTFAPSYTLKGTTEVSSREYTVKSDHAGNNEGEPMQIAEFAGVGNKGLSQQSQDAQVLGLSNTGTTVLEIFYRAMSYDDNSGADRTAAASGNHILNPYFTFLLRPGEFTIMPGLRGLIYNEDEDAVGSPESSAYGTAANFTVTGQGSNCTDGTGYLEKDDFWSQTVTGGIVPGSLCVQFYSAGYQSFGITNTTNAGRRQLPSTSSGLAVNTAHRFKVTIDGTAANIVFTTDSSDVTWGNGITGNGVLKKINEIFLTIWKAGTVTARPRIHIVDGDIRITSGTRLSTSAIAIAASTTGSEQQMFDAGLGSGLPAVGDMDAAIAAALETPTLLKKDALNTSHLLIDQGDGTGFRPDGGAFELRGEKKYNTDNIFCLKNCPPYANFKVFYNYNAAHSGPTLGNGVADNIIRLIYARSVNIGADTGKVKVFVAY